MDDAFFSNPKEIQNRFHVLEVSATGSGLRDWDVPSEPAVDSRRIGLKAACHFGISTQDAILFAVAMFATAPWLGSAQAGPPVAPPPAAGRNQHDFRSRSPQSSGVSHGSDGTSASSEQSITGFPLGDRFFDEHVFEPQIRLEFLEIPVWKRKTIIVKCMERMPDNIHSWLASCIRNNRTAEMAKRLEQGASVQGPRSTAGRANMSGAGLSPEARRACGMSQLSVPSQPVDPSGRLGANGIDRREPATWTAEVIDAWPDKKSKVVQGFLTSISPATQAKVQALAPATQACVAMSVALHVCEGDSADILTDECLRRLQGGTQGRPTSGTGVMSPRPASATIQLQLIFVAPEPLVALVLARSFSSAMETVCPGAFLLLPLVIVSQRDAPSVGHYGSVHRVQQGQLQAVRDQNSVRLHDRRNY